MSEIFAPGSIAGSVGPAGPPTTFSGAYSAGATYAVGQAVSGSGSSYVSLVNGNSGHDPATSPTQWGLLAAAGSAGVAGSAGSVLALTSAILPTFVGQNLFDISKVTLRLGPSATDGTLINVASGATNATALIYCPGATSMVSNLAVDAGNWGIEGICLYDANGAFVSALPTTGLTVVNGKTIVGSTAWTLPGTQVYVRLGYVGSWMPGNSHGWAQSDAAGMIYATITGTATLPSTFQLSGAATKADVSTAAADLLATRAMALDVLTQSVLQGPSSSRNLFDYTKVSADTVLNTDGTTSAQSGLWTSGLIFCPNATSFITNLPIDPSIYPNNPHVCIYDVNGNFLADLSANLNTFPLQNGIIKANVAYPLPGNQTYIRVGGGATTGFGSYQWPVLMQSCVFYAGTVASPPSAITGLNLCTPFAGNAPISIKTATQLGCLGDQSTYGQQDCTPILNAFLATASATNPIKLVLDGNFNVSAPLYIAAAGYTTIEGLGWGTGLNVLGGIPDYTGPNYPGSIVVGGLGKITGAFDATPPARIATNIALRNFSINQSNVNHAQVLLCSCSNVIVENLQFTSAAADNDFMLHISNANQVFVRGCSFASTGYSHDGVHVDGKCEDITVSDCYFATGDDAIALNAPEGYGGDITRVTITNCRFNHSLTVMRIYTSLDPGHMASNNVHKVRNVTVSNCIGIVNGYCFNFGIGGSGLSSTMDAEQLQDVNVSNCTLSAPNLFAWFGTPTGAVSFRGIKFIPTSGAPAVMANFPVDDLTLEDFTILRNADGNASPGSFVTTANSGFINRLTLSHCRVVDIAGSSYAPIPCLIDIGVPAAMVRLEAIDLTHINALASGYATIAALCGNGVLGTGTSVPDSVMANGALYLSSDASGAPSIKVGGVAKRLALA